MPKLFTYRESNAEFANTDLVTNHTVFTDPKSYQALLLNRDLPVSTFSSFIHEATHHWCFISPVGTALSFLYLAAAKKVMVWMGTGDWSGAKQVLDDLFAFEIAVSWLRPINEGLALFAEYDVRYSRSAAFYSPPLTSGLNFLFNLPKRAAKFPHDGHTGAYYEVMQGITEWRLSREVIDRKSDLLLQPLDVYENPYLVGYLVVKQLWRRASAHCEELKNADTFLMFFRKLVFGDYTLVALTLDRKMNPIERGRQFAKSLHDRFELIWSGDFLSLPWNEWEEVLHGKGSLGPVPYNYDVADPVPFALGDDEKQGQLGAELYNQFLIEVIHIMDFPPPPITKKTARRLGIPDSHLPADWFPPDYFYNLLQQRPMMWLGEVPATFKARTPNIVDISVAGEVVIDTYKLPEDVSDPRLQDLKLNIYVDLYELLLVAAIGNDSGTLGLRHWGDPSPESRSRLARNPLHWRSLSTDSHLIQNAVAAYVGGTSFRTEIEKFWNGMGLKLFDLMYTPYAFNFNGEAQSAFAAGGLAAVLHDDPDLVRSVAAISLGASIGLSPERLAAVCRNPALDPFAAIARVKDMWKYERLPLAAVDRDGFLTSIL